MAGPSGSKARAGRSDRRAETGSREQGAGRELCRGSRSARWRRMRRKIHGAVAMPGRSWETAGLGEPSMRHRECDPFRKRRHTSFTWLRGCALFRYGFCTRHRDQIQFQRLDFGQVVNGPNPWHRDFIPYLIQSNFYESHQSSIIRFNTKNHMLREII